MGDYTLSLLIPGSNSRRRKIISDSVSKPSGSLGAHQYVGLVVGLTLRSLATETLNGSEIVTLDVDYSKTGLESQYPTIWCSGMKVFLDDLRDAPEGFIVCRTAEEAFDLIATGEVTFISLDHDLGTELTGYNVANFIETMVHNGRIKMPSWHIHSANPIGVKRIRQALISAERFIV